MTYRTHGVVTRLLPMDERFSISRLLVKAERCDERFGERSFFEAVRRSLFIFL